MNGQNEDQKDAVSVSAGTPLSGEDLRLLHEVGRSDGRPAHNFQKRSNFRPGDLAYYECECGAQSGRFWNILTQQEAC